MPFLLIFWVHLLKAKCQELQEHQQIQAYFEQSLHDSEFRCMFHRIVGHVGGKWLRILDKSELILARENRQAHLDTRPRYILQNSACNLDFHGSQIPHLLVN